MLEKPLLLMGDSATSRYSSVLKWHEPSPTIKSFFRKAWAWPQDHPSGGATDPRILAVLSCLPVPGAAAWAVDSINQERLAGSHPLCTWLSLLLGNCLQCLSVSPGKPLTPWCCWDSLLVPHIRTTWHCLMWLFGRLEMPGRPKKKCLTWRWLKSLKSELPHWPEAPYLVKSLTHCCSGKDR